MNIIILGVRIIEDSDNRGSDNRECTVMTLPEPVKGFTHRQNPGNHSERHARADLKG